MVVLALSVCLWTKAAAFKPCGVFCYCASASMVTRGVTGSVFHWALCLYWSAWRGRSVCFMYNHSVNETRGMWVCRECSGGSAVHQYSLMTTTVGMVLQIRISVNLSDSPLYLLSDRLTLKKLFGSVAKQLP